MIWEAWLTLGIIVLTAAVLLRNLAPPDIALMGSLTLLVTIGAIAGSAHLPTAVDAVRGFGNDGLITVAVLFIVAAGLTNTGAMSLITQPLLGRPRNVRRAQWRLLPPVAALSAFLNNTPIVAVFMPVVSDWCKKNRLAASKLFIPLSYAAILGGTCSLIGTSTNLVVYGWLADNAPRTHDAMGMFTIAAVGLPAAVVGLAYVLIAGPWLLPDRSTPAQDLADARRYTLEMLVASGSAVAGKTITDAGLRNLPGAYLMEIERDGERLVAVGPDQVLRVNDRLIFVGVVESIVDLQRTRGLLPATDQVFKLSDPRPNRQLVEVVVSDSCPLVGQSIRDGKFRSHYDAAVIAVHRNGQHLLQKIGDIVLRPGDTLLLETHPRFVTAHRNSRDFFLVSAVADSQPLRHDKAWVALGILVGMVVLVTAGWLSMLNAALVAAGAMVLTRCCTGTEARAALDIRVLVVIGAALGLGKALVVSGAAAGVAQEITTWFHPLGAWGMVLCVYLLTMLFAETIGHVGAAALMLPIAAATAGQMHAHFMPFAVTIMMAASATFMTPISYQTNLMVYGPGGYKFSDYPRIGLPLNLLVMAVTVGLVPLIWHLH